MTDTSPLWENADEQFIADCLLHDITEYNLVAVDTGGDELDCEPTQDVELIKSHLWQTDYATLKVYDLGDSYEGCVCLVFGHGDELIFDHTSNDQFNEWVSRAQGAQEHAKRKGWLA